MTDLAPDRYGNEEDMDEWLGDDTPVVVGMACRFAGSDGLAGYWERLRAARSALNGTDHWPAEAGDLSGGFLAGHREFDARYFRISPNEARCMDPQQRLLLQEVQHAVDDSYLTVADLRELRCGVFVAGLPGDYRTVVARAGDAAFGTHSFLGNAPSTLSGRISYFYDLTGPSLTLDSACSSSLTALHQALLNVRAGHCRAAIVGAVAVFSTPEVLRFAQRSRMSSPAGTCLPFTDAADGFVPAEGTACVVVTRYDEARARGLRIHGAVVAAGSNHNGTTNGLMAPSARAQAELIADVYAHAGIDAARIAYLETHGTGTPLGDPIELDGLRAAFRRAGAEGCLLGAVKPLIGHTLVCSGLAGVIKVLLSFQHGTVPPAVRPDRPATYLDIAPFTVNQHPVPWPADKPLAAVSAFGFTGSNAHIVLRRPPPIGGAGDTPARRAGRLLPFCLSAESDGSLAELARRYRALAGALTDDRLWDLCQLMLHRPRRTQHRVVLADRRTALVEALAAPPSRPVDLDRLDDDLRDLVSAWLAGGTPALRRHLAAPADLARLTLPDYPFENATYWAVDDDQPATPPPADPPDTGDQGLVDQLCADLSALLGFGGGSDRVTADSRIAALGLDSLTAVQLLGPYQGAGSAIRVPDLFRVDTVADLAAAIHDRTTPADPDGDGTAPVPPAAGARTRWHEYGTGGRPAVLLPPLNCDHRAWVQQITALVRDGRRVYVPAYPGHGDVPFDPTRFSLDRVADDVAEFLHDVPGGADLVGWSLGGCVSVLAALRHPDRVRSLVLVNCAPRYGDDVFERTLELRHELHAHGGLLDVVFDAGGDPAERFSAGASMAVLHDYYRELTAFDIVARLPDVTVPCLVVLGAEDCVVDAGSAALFTRIPGARLRRFDGHGHYLPLTAGRAVNGTLAAFWAERT